MSFLIITKYGDGNGIAWDLAKHGEKVKLWFYETKDGEDKGPNLYKNSYLGIIDQVDNLEDGLKDDPTIIFDQSGMGKLANRLIKSGYSVYGGGGVEIEGEPMADKLEDDRVYFLRWIKSKGVKIPQTYVVKSIEHAHQLAPLLKGKWVVKPNGTHANDKTFIASDPNQIVDETTQWKKDGIKDEGMVIQKFIDGIEVSINMQVSRGKCVYSCRSLIETKKAWPKDLGQMVGCQSSILWGYKDRQPRLFKETLSKLKDSFNGFTGEVDFNCIIDKNGDPHVLEICQRLGYSDIYAALQILPMDPGQYFSDMADGVQKPFQYKPGFGGSLKVSTPPFPFETEDEEFTLKVHRTVKGKKVKFNDRSGEYIPLDVNYGDNRFECAGNTGITLETVSQSLGISRLCNKLVSQAEKVKLANKQYRTDIYENAVKRYNEFNKLGYL